MNKKIVSQKLAFQKCDFYKGKQYYILLNSNTIASDTSCEMFLDQTWATLETKAAFANKLAELFLDL